jgi:hypothetical protein
MGKRYTASYEYERNCNKWPTAQLPLFVPPLERPACPSAGGRLPESPRFAESDVNLGVVSARSVHKVGYGHDCHWATAWRSAAFINIHDAPGQPLPADCDRRAKHALRAAVICEIAQRRARGGNEGTGQDTHPQIEVVGRAVQDARGRAIAGAPKARTE